MTDLETPIAQDGTGLRRIVALASRAKTKVKQRGKRGVLDLTEDESFALAYVADVFLADYTGPLTRGEPDLNLIPELETP
ncbi:hypothetical protein AN189_02975 [Loktanella sp. 3ANDIMAR09]|uniref:hypothetical protein n=1 Tax=Loktanella sp. 3ANDIMAR09 TaxID=1225657 RepID=UPI0006FF8C68|nr:hypothetical protein [Loktanella sp. 3ANDIMAR09]KQI69400.1 hypothetical protein AN189_02975 [Loktanella sp. 3ANDIMAR09]